MMAIIITYLVFLIPAIIFTQYMVKHGFLEKLKINRILFFFSVWFLTPGFFVALIIKFLRK